MASSFRHTIPSDRFSAEKGRYVLYINYICPWAHRTIIIRVLKKLEDIVELVEVDDRDAVHGWSFSGRTGPSKDPIYGVKTLKEIYQKADPHYDGRVTVPLLWDKQHGTAVNNESTDIARMLIDGFDSLLPPEQREANKGVSAFRPSHLVPEIDALNSWMYDTVNNGVYKIGFATSVQSYNEHLGQLFQTLDRLEVHLSQPKHHPYLFGQFITESDIYLFTTLIRFDVAYYSFFKCNLRMIRRDYPCLHAWLRRLYWNTAPETCGGVFRSSTNFDAIARGYSSAVGRGATPKVVVLPIMPL
ncbi:hypothetical protein COCSADRAFT_136591 [Bipolaris sorokiniana ND90Pr]|uniref:GST N-terminal domain-containing protein n=1 Tax=Cochliobolus sativus (strain ND90Pr / ATCC 201652) TaxID=665912 RepID=M2SK26_COCSN|nr:uncharacterized protein COCSADRAFT_136591 [Bipolaris sorokiniana ND90Pr]EMD67533.1 hypothetical protein COCSADRAFT_136591 [Bipolaris sorokiniana ND90Pr]